jgi:hypothetical protein
MSPWHHSPRLSRPDLPVEPADRLPLNRMLLAERRLLLSRFCADAAAGLKRPSPAGLLRRVWAWLHGGRA